MGERFEWVEIIEPSRHEHMFANLKTGQCLWDPPAGVVVKPTHENQWWELFDTKTRRYYYYNAASQETVWYKPKDGDIIPLSKLQMLKSREATCHQSSVPRKLRTEKKCDNNNIDNKKIDNVVKQESVKIGEKKMGSHSRESLHGEESKCVKIKDTEIISSSTNVKRSASRTMTLGHNLDHPIIKEKPKFSSLRQKAPPKPPRSSINVFDKSTNNLSISVEKTVDKTIDKTVDKTVDNTVDKTVEKMVGVENEKVGSSTRHGTRSPTNKIKVIERPKGPAPAAPMSARHSTPSMSSQDTIMTITTRNSICVDKYEQHPKSIPKETSEYASPSDIIPCRESFSSFTPKEERTILYPTTSTSQVVEYAPIIKVTNSTAISQTVEYACPMKVVKSTVSSSASVQDCSKKVTSKPSGTKYNEYDTPEDVEDVISKPSVTKCNEYDTPLSILPDMIVEQNVSGKINVPLCPPSYGSDVISMRNNNKNNKNKNTITTTSTTAANNNSDNNRNNKYINDTLPGHYPEPVIIPPTPVTSGTYTYQNIESETFPDVKHASVPRDYELITEMEDSIDEQDSSAELSRRSLEFPVNAVPAAPPPPKVAPRRLLPSMYDNVSSGTLSMYDNSSENDDHDDTFNSGDGSLSPRYNLSGSSDEAFDPSASNLLGNDSPDGNYYDRLDNEMDGRSATLPSPHSSPRKLPAAPADIKTPPTKRNPTLVRMKSDPIVDVEKRAKISKTIGSIQSTFRPISMLNLSNNIANNKHSKRCVLGSESDLPERPQQVPLSTHRTGILRRRMSIHSMLSWSKSCIKKPMVLTRDKAQRKDAVDVFKLILMCMGDKSTRRKHDDVCVDIVTKGWSTPPLRDEIYIQLCKQTTGNRRIPSVKQGWELITACLSMFPPSNKFHSYLEGYISRHLDCEDENVIQANVPKYAKYCHKQLERICQTGAKRGLKGPTIDEIHAAIKRVFNPSMFGNTLEDVLEMQKDRFPELRLPWILTTLTESVLQQNGLQTEGIFRVPGDIDDVNQLKLMVDQWQAPVQTSDPTVPASLLKLWFRDLYEPLIPQRFYDQCIHNCDDPEITLNIVQSLPSLNNLIFSYLIRLLQAFVIPENVAMSKMDENNLAMVWAPNCLRCPSDDPREIFENTRKEMTFLRTVLKVLDTSFLEGVL